MTLPTPPIWRTPWRAPMGESVAVAVLSLVIATPTVASAQGVVVDQGSFAVTLDGRPAGTEDFTIRRAGLNRDDALFATATVTLQRDGASHQIRLLLRATPTDGLPKCEGSEPCYQVDVEGPEALSLRLGLTGRRYVARIVDGAGEEIREFPATAGTRVLENDVAHLYYFLKDVGEGTLCPVVSPRERGRTTLTAGAWSEEQIQLGPNVVQTRRVEFSAGEDLRIVWFDRLGRVLRVSVPTRGYLAERTDLVG
jgi:hypothetical protein